MRRIWRWLTTWVADMPAGLDRPTWIWVEGFDEPVRNPNEN